MSFFSSSLWLTLAWVVCAPAGAAPDASTLPRRLPPAESATRAPASAPAVRDTPYVMPNSSVDTIVTPTGREYRLMVSWPEGRAPAAGWPVLYVLDGERYFPMATDMLRNQVCPFPCTLEAGVIVAIGYTDRSRRDFDYTPKAPPGPPEMKLDGTPYPVVDYGGADIFLDVIEQIVKPRIESRWPIDKSRQGLFGHSFGGLLVLHALYSRPLGFTNYTASSPSIWWNNRYIEKEEQAFLKRLANKPLARETRLLVTVGGSEQTLLQRELRGSATEQGNLEWRRGRRRMVDNTKALVERLQDADGRNLSAVHREFDDETHLSVAPMALSASVGMNFTARSDAR